MKLSIIIVSWNTCDLLEACLNSVFLYPPSVDFEVWLVDNNSQDDSLDMVRSQFPQVKIIENDMNVGFAEANNQAIQRSQGSYILLLNPDTEVTANAIQSLVDFMDKYADAGAVGACLLNPDGTLQTSCSPRPTLFREWWRMAHFDTVYAYGRYNMHTWDKQSPREVDVIQGAALLLRKSVLDKIGSLDSSYFMYSEEVDLCVRIQKAGWRLYWAPASQVVHYGGQSTNQVAGEMFEHLYSSKVLFFRKHYGQLSAEMYKFILLITILPRILLTPLARLQTAEKQQRSQQMGRRYRQLLKTLPKM